MSESGWYPDPTGEHELRWFDGVAWTTDVRGSSAPIAATPQLDLAPIAATPQVDPAMLGESAVDESLTILPVAVGLFLVVWSQVLSAVVFRDVWFGSSGAWFAAALVLGAGAAAASVLPARRGQLAVSTPVAAVVCLVALEVLPLSYDVAQRYLIAVVVGAAVGAALLPSAWTVAAGAVAGLAVGIGGTVLGIGELTGIFPFFVGDRGGADMEVLALALVGPCLLGAIPAFAVGLASRPVPLDAFGGPASVGTGFLGDTRAFASADRAVDTSAAESIVINTTPDLLAGFAARELVGQGALVTVQSPLGISGHVITKGKPSMLKAVLLWFICVVPMIIYLLNASKDVTEPFSLSLEPTPHGTNVMVGGSGRGLAAAEWVVARAQATWPATI